ncbi:MAG: transporter [Desulfohalobiaceae bacterium]
MKINSRLIQLFACLCILGCIASSSFAYNQPPGLNLGATNVLDGMIPPPGLHMSNYIVSYHSDDFQDAPGDNELYALIYNPQLVWVSKKSLPGDLKYGFQAQLPLQSYDLDSTIQVPEGTTSMETGNSILGDLNFGPFIGRTEKLHKDWLLHWFFELDIFAPTGDYNKQAQINPSSNYWSLEPFLALTLQMPQGFSFSTRQMLTYNFTNDEYVPFGAPEAEETDLQAGSMWHCNFSLMKTLDFIDTDLRLGAVGYYGKQLEEDEIDNYPELEVKEEVFGIGPGLHWMNKGVVWSLKTYFESSVENRPKGTRVVLRIINSF